MDENFSEQISELKSTLARIENALEEVRRKTATPLPEPDETGGLDLAIRITGKAASTLYKYTMLKAIPFTEKGKRLYFSKKELISWIKGEWKNPNDSSEDGVMGFMKKRRNFGKNHLK